MLQMGAATLGVDFAGSRLVFEREGAKEEFEFYRSLKGRYAYAQAISLFREKYGNPVFYSEVSSLIRYDISVRRELYVYLACLEEYWKSILCEKVDIPKECGNIKKHDPIFCDSNESNSNLFFALSVQEIDLGRLIHLMGVARISLDPEKAEQIKKLRNTVMHHNFICLGSAKNSMDLSVSLASLRGRIEALYSALPDFYKSILERNLNACLKPDEKNFTRISLGRMENGKFVVCP